MFILCEREPSPYKELQQNESLLKSSRDTLPYSNGSIDKRFVYTYNLNNINLIFL